MDSTLAAVADPFQPFLHELPFSPSAYQREALAALARPGVSVIVVAPTGSGKTLVADAAIWQTLRSETAGATGATGTPGTLAPRTVAYTSPLRTLANQRFEQLGERWGMRTGLVTGERVVRPQAPLRVMTAEVYRTLALLGQVGPVGPIAPGPPAGTLGDAFVARLAWAIFDEAHYLADPERGAVWEEAVLATPPEARLLCLSATIGQPERLAGWLRWLGREVILVEARQRPVPLRHYLFLRGTGASATAATAAAFSGSPALHLVLDEAGQRAATFPFAGGWALAQRRPAPSRPAAGPRRRPPPPAGLPAIPPDDWVRQEALAALELLRQRQLTPAIAFVSSRREAERLAAAAAGAFPEAADGVAAHHAGLHPAERRLVEQRLRQGSLWLVCATTTLAAGLDAPARSVLVTSFGRFDGRSFSLFTPAEYRQLTGRAGRLGKDQEGAAVLLASPWHGFEEAFRRLTAPLPALHSAYRPAYAGALAWWSAGQHAQSREEREQRLAAALGSTFAAYLRRADRKAAAPPPLPPDGPSLLQARALGKLLLLDGLVDEGGTLTPPGRFVLRAGGGPEGRLLLRLLESGALAALDQEVRAAVLAALAEGPLPAPAAGSPDATAASIVDQARRQQVSLERQAGTSLTPAAPGAPAPSRAAGNDAWRRRQAAVDLLERVLSAARASGAGPTLLDWGPPLLAHLSPA